MKTNGCSEITDANNRGLTESGEHHTPYGFIIPACILVGLGVGLLVDHLGTGFLVGLGAGFLGSGLLPMVRKPWETEGMHIGNIDVTMLLIGTFLIVVGIGIVYAPAALWPYAIAGFLILVGLWLLVRGFSKTA